MAEGEAADLIPQIARDYGACKVLYGRTYDPPRLATQEKVEEALDKAGIDTESFNSSLLQEPWETKNGTGKPFQVFTPIGENRDPSSIANRPTTGSQTFFLHIAYPKTKP